MITGTYYTTCSQLAIVLHQSAEHLGSHLFGYVLLKDKRLVPSVWKESGINIYRASLDLDLSQKLSDNIEDITNWKPLKMEKGEYIDSTHTEWVIFGKNIAGNWVGYSIMHACMREFNYAGVSSLSNRPDLVKQISKTVKIDE